LNVVFIVVRIRNLPIWQMNQLIQRIQILKLYRECHQVDPILAAGLGDLDLIPPQDPEIPRVLQWQKLTPIHPNGER
jgi:hypothetical protein